MTIQLVATEKDRTDVLTIGGDYISRRTHDVHGSLLTFDKEAVIDHTPVEFSRNWDGNTGIYGLSKSLLEDRVKGLASMVDLDLFMQALASLPIANDPKLYYMGMSNDMLPSIASRVAWDVKAATDPSIGRFHIGTSEAIMSVPHYGKTRTTIDAVPLFRAWGLDTNVWFRADLAKHIERTGAALGPRSNYPSKGSYSDKVKSKLLARLGTWRETCHTRLNQFVVSEESVLALSKMVKDTVTNKPFSWVHHIN
tara:strand:- start:256 stop:1014 length:759 start_codon:yes stop_codon:yes gene_type:complete